MKIIFAFIFTILSMPLILGQITESKQLMSKGEKNALTVTLPDTEEKVVTKEWESYIKGYKAKLRNIKKSSEIFADDAKLPTISNNTVDVYALINQRGDDTKLTVWYDLGGVFLNSETHPDRYTAAQNMLKNFSGVVSKTYVANLLQEEEKKMKDLEGALKDLVKSRENSVKDIEKYEQKILDEKANIEDCKKKEIQAAKDVEAQMKIVKEVKTTLNN